MTARSLTLGARSYPLVLPSLRDPRLHVAAVIISVHVLGQVALHFRVSVIQILAAIIACALIEIVLTFRQSRSFVWPASAMLTGSGVALILRVVGQPADQPWLTNDWWLFALIAGLSLLTKYVIRYRGTHIFNPSNIGLVAAFVVLGAGRIEPLDFWWAPLNPAMIAAYAVIVGGGLLITRRLHLLALALVFWLALAASVGLLTASGHCIITNWAFAPVCGFSFWQLIVTSPEVMIFLFFMITDPRTVPAGRVGRIVFGVLVALAATLLMAPQTDEFGTKVGLLGSLVLLCAARPLVDRIVPEPRSAADSLRRYAARLASPLRAGAAMALVLVSATAIVVAGIPARTEAASVPVLRLQPGLVDPSTLPTINVGQDVIDFDHELAGAGMQAVVITLAQNLELENQALLTRDASILPTVDHGDRLAQMQASLAAVQAGGAATVTHYRFDSIDASLLVPFGMQTGLSLGLAGSGTLVEQTYAATGTLTLQQERPFSLTFAMRRATGDRWLNVAVLPQP
jgi:Na+-translocating ferredoxin:NAD+ oxidoreductase RnfD subunit